MKIITGGVCAAQGFKANGIHCGIRKNHAKKDLALIVSDDFLLCDCSACVLQLQNRIDCISHLSLTFLREVCT